MSQFKRGKGWVSKFVWQGDQYWTPGGPWSTKQDAADAESAYRQELKEEREAGPKRWTCGEYGPVWLEENEGKWAPTTFKLYESAVTRFNEEFGNRYMDSIQRREAKSWAASVTRSTSRVIATMFNAAVDDGLIATNRFIRMGLTKKDKKRREAPSMDDYRATLLACGVLDGYGPEFQRMVTIAAWTGIRQGELFALRWEDLDAGAGKMWIRQNRRSDGSIGLPKNGEEREILWPEIAQVLGDHRRRANSPFVFHTATGKPLLPTSFYWAWNPVRKAAGIRWRWHDWRHFCATQLLELGVDHFAVSVQLGHEDGGKLVMERYGHPSHDLAKDRLRMAFAGLETGSEIGSKLPDVADGSGN